MTLEERLLTYDWQTQFRTFQKVTQKGSFKVHCVGATDATITVSGVTDMFTYPHVISHAGKQRRIHWPGDK